MSNLKNLQNSLDTFSTLEQKNSIKIGQKATKNLRGLLAAGAIALTSCGGGGGGTTNPTQPTQPTQPTVPTFAPQSYVENVAPDGSFSKTINVGAGERVVVLPYSVPGENKTAYFGVTGPANSVSASISGDSDTNASYGVLNKIVDGPLNSGSLVDENVPTATALTTQPSSTQNFNIWSNTASNGLKSQSTKQPEGLPKGIFEKSKNFSAQNISSQSTSQVVSTNLVGTKGNESIGVKVAAYTIHGESISQDTIQAALDMTYKYLYMHRQLQGVAIPNFDNTGFVKILVTNKLTNLAYAGVNSIGLPNEPGQYIVIGADSVNATLLAHEISHIMQNSLYLGGKESADYEGHADASANALGQTHQLHQRQLFENFGSSNVNYVRDFPDYGLPAAEYMYLAESVARKTGKPIKEIFGKLYAMPGDALQNASDLTGVEKSKLYGDFLQAVVVDNTDMSDAKTNPDHQIQQNNMRAFAAPIDCNETNNGQTLNLNMGSQQCYISERKKAGPVTISGKINSASGDTKGVAIFTIQGDAITSVLK